MSKLELLDQKDEIAKIDRQGMLQTAEKMPEMLVEAMELSRGASIPKIKKIRHIIISGMGGSAIAGNIAANLFSNSVKVPLYVNRDYQLPAFADRGTLFFALSYSGNTEETLSAVKEAAMRGAKIICAASGGKLKEVAEKNGYPLFLIPAGYQPRAALPYLLAPVLVSLERMGTAPSASEELNEAAELLQKLKEEYGMSRSVRSNPVKQLAKTLLSKIPLILAGCGTTEAAGLRLKTQFNENSKVTALFNVFPELDHNEIVNLSVLKREEHSFCALLLRDEKDSERLKKRMEVTKSLIGRQLGGVKEIYSRGKSQLARILSLVYFGDLLSVYLAILRGVDPTPVEVISRLKKELGR